MGGTEEDQSYSFAGGRLQRYTHIHRHTHNSHYSALLLISHLHSLKAGCLRILWISSLFSGGGVCVSSIIHCAHVQRKHCQAERLGGECSHGSCNAASGPVAALAGLGSARLSLARPYKALLARGKENTFSWAIDPLVNVVCSCVCAQKCNYRTRWERWSLGNMSVTPHTFSAPTTALHHFFLSSCFHKLFF